MPRSGTHYIGLNDLAARWGMNPRTLYRWLTRGRIAGTGIVFAYSRVGRRYGWTESQVADLEAAMEQAGRPAPARQPATAGQPS